MRQSPADRQARAAAPEAGAQTGGIRRPSAGRRRLAAPGDQRGGQQQDRLRVGRELRRHWPRLEGQGRAATPRRSRASAAATRRPSTSTANPPCRPPAAPDPPGKESRETASEPSTFRACCVPLAIDFCSARSSICSSVRWNGSPDWSARRSAKSGTRSGCRRDGMQVTHSGAGCGAHRASNEAQARTSSSENCPSRYLPRPTSPPQPASPQMQSAFPGSARQASGMNPRTSYRGMPPMGHRRRGSIGRLVRRRNATASCRDSGATLPAGAATRAVELSPAPRPAPG